MELTHEITAKIILDSEINNIRVTTFEVRYPRIIHGEFMTHRVFSRNASSSRAIPVERMIADHSNYLPENWRQNQKGMQPAGFFRKRSNEEAAADDIWVDARDNAIASARELMELGVAKEQANRLLEPFMFIKVIVTATDYQNFFSLRCHTDAQYEIRILAEKMRELYNNNLPTKRLFHLPYVINDSIDLDKIKCSVARCARVSYATHDGQEPIIANDIILYDRLVGSKPIHASPAEHQVFDPDFYHEFRINHNLTNWPVNTDTLHGNFKQGVVQYRKIIEKLI